MKGGGQEGGAKRQEKGKKKKQANKDKHGGAKRCIEQKRQEESQRKLDLGHNKGDRGVVCTRKGSVGGRASTGTKKGRVYISRGGGGERE